MKLSLTQLLAALVLVAAIAAAVAWSRLDAARTGALAAQRDLSTSRQNLADLATWHVAVRTDSDPAGDDADFNRRIRDAASAATLADQLTSIEPGPTVRVRDSDVVRTPIYLRLDGVSLRGLVTFLHEIVSRDAVVRVTGIELSVPVTAAAKANEELWTADVTLSETAVGATGPK